MERHIPGERPKVCPDYRAGEHYLFEVKAHVFFEKFFRTKGREPTASEVAAYSSQLRKKRTPSELAAVRACPVCVEQIRQAKEQGVDAFPVPQEVVNQLRDVGLVRFAAGMQSRVKNESNSYDR